MRRQQPGRKGRFRKESFPRRHLSMIGPPQRRRIQSIQITQITRIIQITQITRIIQITRITRIIRITRAIQITQMVPKTPTPLRQGIAAGPGCGGCCAWPSWLGCCSLGGAKKFIKGSGSGSNKPRRRRGNSSASCFKMEFYEKTKTDPSP